MNCSAPFWAGVVILAGWLVLAPMPQAQAQPAWSVNPADFESSLSATIAVSLAGLSDVGSADLLAAFEGETVRGTASPTDVGGQSLFFLTIYGDGQGQTITFRYFDATGDRECSVSETLTYQTNGVLGALTDPLQLTGSCASATYSADEIATPDYRLTAFPNPAQSAFAAEVNVPAAGGAHVRVFDLLGRLVYSGQEWLEPGRNQVALDLGALWSNGTYLLVVDVGRSPLTTTLTVRR